MRKSKQEKRDDEARAISQQMKRLITGFRTLLEAALEGEGITLAQLRMLHALEENPEASAAELARTCFITPQSMQAVVKRAEQHGWITRRPSAANRRVLTATLTAVGRQLLQRGSELHIEISREVWGRAALAEMQTIARVLEDAISQMQPSLRALHTRGTAAVGAAQD